MVSPLRQADNSEPVLGGLLPPLISFLAAGIAARVLLLLILFWKLRPVGPVCGAVIYLAWELSVTILAGRLAFMLFEPHPYVPVWDSLRRFAVVAAWFAPVTVFAKLGLWWGVIGGCTVAIILAKCLRNYQL